MIEGLRSSAAEMDRKYWIALALFAILALLVWFTMGEGKVFVLGKPVELRLLPLIVIGGLALRTVLARSAEKIRRGGEKDSF
jgi:cytochrome bd-type quinol oxidase subunit 2